MYLSEPTAGSRWGSLGQDAPAISGLLPVTDWCSDKNPQGKCKPLKNICKAMYSSKYGGRPVLENFKGLQTEVNRAHGRPTLWVDGRIGPETIKYSFIAFAKMGRPLPADPAQNHCDWWAARAAVLRSNLKALNDAAGKGAVGSKEPRGETPTGLPGGLVSEPPMPQRAGFGEFLTTPLGLGLVAGGVILALMIKKDKKKAKRKKPVRRRRRPRTRITRTYY